ncbi:MAG: type II toxin-antitoxin system HicA family toxin [Betaproteobacteria bacterium]|nr:type II toxin-antitoxin system HicA family toxin [Betaproteobacteria bacterium]
MPKFPGFSVKEIVRALEKLGFRSARQSGSHILMKKGEKGCVVPNHKEVKVGTVNGVLRQAQISPEEFQKAISD